jgi:hypothetical protein
MFTFGRMRIGSQNLTLRLCFCRNCVEGNYICLVYIYTARRKCNQKLPAVVKVHTSEYLNHLLKTGNKRMPSRTNVAEKTAAGHDLGFLEHWDSI